MVSCGPRTGLRVEIDEDLPSSSQQSVLAELSVSSGVGHLAVAAYWQRPELSAYIETITKNVSELSNNNYKDQPDEILKWRIMTFWRNHEEAIRASTWQTSGLGS